MIEAPGLRCAALACTVKNTRGQIGSDDFFKEARDVLPIGVAPVSRHSRTDIEFAELSYGCGNGALEISDFRHVRLYRPALWFQVPCLPHASVFGFRPVIATWAPSARNSRAVANQFHYLPPVINAVLLSVSHSLLVLM